MGRLGLEEEAEAPAVKLHRQFFGQRHRCHYCLQRPTGSPDGERQIVLISRRSQRRDLVGNVHSPRRSMTLLQRIKKDLQMARHQRRLDLLSKEHVATARERLTKRRSGESDQQR